MAWITEKDDRIDIFSQSFLKLSDSKPVLFDVNDRSCGQLSESASSVGPNDLEHRPRSHRRTAKVTRAAGLYLKAPDCSNLRKAETL